MEGSLVPGRDLVKPLFCSIHILSRQGLLYLLAIEKLLLESCFVRYARKKRARRWFPTGGETGKPHCLAED
jgi:hypothetical protein